MFYITGLEIRGGYNISGIILKPGYYILFHPILYYWTNYLFFWAILELKHDVLNFYCGKFQYSRQGPGILWPIMEFLHKLDVLKERKIYEEEYLSKNIPDISKKL